MNVMSSRASASSVGSRLRLIIPAVLVISVLAGAWTILLNSGADHHAVAGRAHELGDTLQRISGVEDEWRDADSRARAIVVRQLLVLGNRVAADSQGLEQNGSEHRLTTAVEVVNREVHNLANLVSNGDLELASASANARLDPAIDKAIAEAEAVSASETSNAKSAERAARMWVWFVTTICALMIIVGGWIVIGIRDADRETRRRDEADRVFRSLIEASSDVITLVTGSDSLLVLSPTTGVLTDFAANKNPIRMDQLLSDEALAQWEAADGRLRESGLRQHLDFELERVGGSSSFVEGHGSKLDGDPDTRVWTWRDVSERIEFENQLTHQAFHDPLTGVANRALLLDRVEHALRVAVRTNEPVTVMFCDLDEFKTINDSLGHAVGDELLGTITKRICGCVRDTDTVARLGGDEFGILLETVDSEKAQALAERILSVVAYEVRLAGRSVFPSMSIGIATATPGMTSGELLRDADLAMYSAKRSGKGRSCIYEDDMHHVATDVLELEADLRQALEQGEFTLCYQPTLDLETSLVEGVEALIRWSHPVRGTMSPADFIPRAEASGMIVAIGRWVLQEACRAAVELQRDRDRPILMHVNISPQQLRDPSIVDTVVSALSAAALPANLLVLEVTEGVLLDNESAVARLTELRNMGVRIAVDDFGTGYTSISYLQQLPIDILKIDRSFVSGDALEETERNAFLHAILGLAKTLNLVSVAEGIEEPHQLKELIGLGCNSGQGFLWAKGTPLAEVTEAINEIDRRATLVRSEAPA